MSFAAETPRPKDRTDFAAQLTELRQEQFSPFEDESLAWLAMPPAWTERLAETAKFPTGSLKLPEFLARTEQARLAWRGPAVETSELIRRRTGALLVLLSYLTAKQREHVVPLIEDGLEAVDDHIERLRVQIALLPCGPGGPSASEREASLLADIGGQPTRTRARLMARLVAVDHSQSVISAAIAAVREVPDAEEFCRRWAAIVSAVSDQAPLAEEGRAVAARIDHPEGRADALLLLGAALNSPDLKREVQEAAIAAIGSIKSPQDAADVLINALPTLASEPRQQAVALALQRVPAIANVVDRAKALRALAAAAREHSSSFSLDEQARSALAEELRATADAVAVVQDPAKRDAGLAAIAVAFAAMRLFDQASASTTAIAAPESRVLALLRIAVFQSDTTGKPPSDGFDELAALPAPVREVLLAAMPVEAAKYLPRGLSSEIADCVEAMVSDRRFEPALKLVRLLEPTQKDSSLRRMLTVAGAIGSEEERTAALAQLAPHLTEAMLDRAIEMVSESRPPDRPFAIFDVLRGDVLQYLRERPNALPLHVAATRAGRAVLAAVDKQRLDVAPATMRWAQIASQCEDLGKAADFITKKVNVAVELGDLGDALEYAKATNELAASIGRDLELAAVQAQHRIGLAFRSAADERHLAQFLPRKEYSDTIAALLADGSKHWAVHFLGLGGVGKTMLMRQLTARLAVRDGRRLPTSRIDFDPINPEYPVRKPGELLAVLAEELRMFGGEDQEDRYRKFHGDLKEFHGALSASPPPDDPLQNIKSPGFERLLQAFAALLDGLPKPVIFILDTCEELAKLDPVGSALPSVEATFRIIERVHKQAGGAIRVVFAGRRLLARSGAVVDGRCDWTIHADTLPERSKLLPECKDYLRLHVMRGFSEREADEYFARIIGISLKPDQREAILRQSLDAGIAVEIDFAASGSPRQDRAPRYNPFDLSLYADWVKKDPNVAAETLGSGDTDPYVEMRIIQQIKADDLRDAIHYAVLLRRFDMDMLRPASRGGGEDLARLFRDLGGQEWMEYQQDALQVDPKFLPRLQRYFDRPARRPLVDHARARLAPALIGLVRKFLDADDPFESLAVRHLDAVLRLAPEREAAELWDRFERRLFASGNWYWAETVCRFLLDRENAAGDETSWVHAAVCATYNAVLVHTQPGYPVRDIWAGIAKTAARHPDRRIGAFIALRAHLWTEPLADVLEEVERFDGDEWQREQLGASLVATIERELEKPVGSEFGSAMSSLAEASWERVSPEVTAALYCATARCTRAPQHLARAKALADHLAGHRTAQRWGDWRAPAALASRIRLEALRIAPAKRNELELWSAAAAADIDTIDGERLLSRTLTLRLQYGPVDPPQLTTEQIYDPRRKAESSAHFETLPLVVAWVDAALSLRLDDRLIEVVSVVRMKALEHHDNGTVQAADAIRLKLERRLRTLSAIQALAELIPAQHPDSTKFHRWWAMQVVNSDDDAARLLAQIEKLSPDDLLRGDKELDLFSFLDLAEAAVLAKRIGQEGSSLARLVPTFPTEEIRYDRSHDDPDLARIRVRLREAGSFAAASGDSERFVSVRVSGGAISRIRLELRARALHPAGGIFADDPLNVEPRCLAEIALEEGDLLALRLPEQAIRLFEEAHRLFVRSNDHLGENIAAICAAMAACRAGDRNSAPAWLERVGRELDDQTLGVRTDGAHGAWVLRTAACRAWVEEPDGSGPRTRSVAEELGRRYGNAAQPEIAFAPMAQTQETLSEISKRGVVAGAVALFSAVVVVVLGSAGAGKWISENTELAFAIASTAIGTVIYGATLWGFMVGVSRWFGRQLFLIVQRAIVVAPNPGGGGALYLTVLRSSPLIRSAFVKLYGHAAVIDQPSFHAYRESSRLIPRAMNRTLRTFGIEYSYALFVEASLAHFPWEALVAFRASNLTGGLGGDIHFVRPGQALPRTPDGLTEWDKASIRIVARRGIAYRGWTLDSTGDVRTLESLPLPPVPPLRVLHLIGRARRGTSGPVFSIGGQGSDLGELVNIDRLPLSSAAVVIVQEEPAERLRRLDVDREQTADARHWAAQVFRAGAQTVIFLPAMPLAMGWACVTEMARRLDRAAPPDVWRLIDVVRAARRTAIRFSPDRAGERSRALAAGLDRKARRDAQRELALDITLFTRAEEFAGAYPKKLQDLYPFTTLSTTGTPHS